MNHLAKSKRDCLIEAVGKQRNGKPRYWCIAHGAPATGRYGSRLNECESAYRDKIDGPSFLLEADRYRGGVALWGSVEPVYDTTGREPERGVHVHAREHPGADKVIDGTFDSVILRLRKETLFEEPKAFITSETAVAYYIGRLMDRDIGCLFCVYCGEAHLDAGWFAVKPHHRHLCHGCGRIFSVPERGISNPIMAMRGALGDSESNRLIERSSKTLDMKQSDFPGGLQIWASNPALLWTAPKPEEEGIHVHAFDGVDPEPVVNDTFDKVTIDDVELNEGRLRFFMAQRSLAYLSQKIVVLSCPACGEAHCDVGEEALIPHKTHVCHHCDAPFETPGRRKKVVSNPFLETISELRKHATN